jgi:hypothetical protein
LFPRLVKVDAPKLRWLTILMAEGCGAWLLLYGGELQFAMARQAGPASRTNAGLDDGGPFKTAGGELAAGDFNKFRTPDPPHGFWRGGRFLAPSEAFSF